MKERDRHNLKKIQEILSKKKEEIKESGSKREGSVKETLLRNARLTLPNGKNWYSHSPRNGLVAYLSQYFDPLEFSSYAFTHDEALSVCRYYVDYENTGAIDNTIQKVFNLLKTDTNNKIKTFRMEFEGVIWFNSLSKNCLIDDFQLLWRAENARLIVKNKWKMLKRNGELKTSQYIKNRQFYEKCYIEFEHLYIFYKVISVGETKGLELVINQEEIKELEKNPSPLSY